MHEELSGEGFTVIAVALDESVDDVMPFVDEITYPVLIDQEHVLSELYAISNVPTVIWIDENDRIARPNGVAFGTDMFSEFSGITTEPHRQLIRAWVHDDEVDVTPDEARAAVGDLTEDELSARLVYRIALHLRREGRDDEAAARFERAAELAPHDFTIRRAAMPLVGEDPFGEKFFELYGEWEADGSQYHGLVPERTA